MRSVHLQRALVCLHYDPQLAIQLSEDPERVAALLSLQDDELSALLRVDARAYRVDEHRGSRLLTVLVEQFAASITLARIEGWSATTLPAFLQSLALRQAIMTRASSSAAFASWLTASVRNRGAVVPGSGVEGQDDLLSEVIALEAALSLVRRARADRRAYDLLREATPSQARQTLFESSHDLWCLAPWCTVVRRSMRAVEVMHGLRGLADEEVAGARADSVPALAGLAPSQLSSEERPASERVTLIVDASGHFPRARRVIRRTKSDAQLSDQLIEQRARGDASISSLSPALAVLLEAAGAGLNEAMLCEIIGREGGSVDDARELREELISDCVLIRAAFLRPRRDATS